MEAESGGQGSQPSTGRPAARKHPGKTFVSRIEKGFDFLGYHFSPRGLTLARQTIVNFLERAIRLYEQEPGEETAPVRLGAYARRWERWTRSAAPSGLSSELHQRQMAADDSLAI